MGALLDELSSAYRGTAYVLGDVIEADDGYTGEHSRGVVELVMETGQRLGLSADRLRNLEFGALLHDVGKIAIPNEIINKRAGSTPTSGRSSRRTRRRASSCSIASAAS